MNALHLSGGRSVTVGLVMGAVGAVAAAQTPSGGQATRAGIAGVVRDTAGTPIYLAKLTIGGNTATTDDSGRFDVRGLASGTQSVAVTKIGYAPVFFDVTLPPDSLVVLAIRLRRAQRLDPVTIEATRINAALAQTGFIDRQRVGLGTFLSPQRVDSLAAVVFQPSQLLRGVRGIDLRCKLGCAEYVPVPHNLGTDCLWLFVDGVRRGLASEIDELGLSPSAIAAIEVYDRASAVPMEFQGAMPRKQGRGFSTGSGCGAVAYWTKTRVPLAP